LAFLKCPFSGAGVFFSFLSPTPNWIAVYPSLASVFTCVTTQGRACIVVQGLCLPSASYVLVTAICLHLKPGIFLFLFYQTLISTSTPLGNSNLIRASTVFEEELYISSSRL